ncbi:hypothetical protein K4L44_00900 [Halosquirtibacter laminarini]|uniref:Uncharacterized protein n=1 Tax=Halosquirtibacter laminarini TaxID=3374600 RepID=A0AC61NPN2_9BACT|nr:hypothetical protein K4L44_00900 [Prolixibacteraceae bacterium]
MKKLLILIIGLTMVTSCSKEKAQKIYDETIMVYIAPTELVQANQENILAQITEGVQKGSNVIVGLEKEKILYFYQLTGDPNPKPVGSVPTLGYTLGYGQKLFLDKVKKDFISKKYQNIIISESTNENDQNEDVALSIGKFPRSDEYMRLFFDLGYFYEDKDRTQDYTFFIIPGFGDPNIAYSFGKFASYVAASPTDIDLINYPYKELFSELTNTKKSVRERLISGCKAYAGHAFVNDIDGSIALYDCKKFEETTKQFRNMCRSLLDVDLYHNLVKNNPTKLTKNLSQYDFMEMVEENFSEVDSKSLKKSLEASVLYKKYIGPWSDGLCGMGVFVPNGISKRYYQGSFARCWSSETEYAQLVSSTYFYNKNKQALPSN